MVVGGVAALWRVDLLLPRRRRCASVVLRWLVGGIGSSRCCGSQRCQQRVGCLDLRVARLLDVGQVVCPVVAAGGARERPLLNQVDGAVPSD
jgi:hypothetical protein